MAGLTIGLCTGVVIGASIVFGSLQFVTNHVATVENETGKYGVVQTSRMQFAIKLK